MMLDKLENIVRRVGAELLAIKDTAAAQGTWHGTQLKTEADRVAHTLTSDLLAEVAPEISVISEEDEKSHRAPRPDRYFLIDPIDGTASYAEGFPGYVTQIALMQDKRPELAAIFAPAFDQAFLAARGRGATLNGRRLELTPSPDRNVLIDNYPEPRGTALQVMNDLSLTGYMECGGIALKICRIADGSADIFFKDVTVRDWDVAAPEVVVSEAGGLVCDLNGNPFIYDGNYEKPGIISASTLDRGAAIHKWIDSRTNTDSKGTGT